MTCVQAFRENFDFVYRCVQRHGVRGVELDDVVQEVFIAMWRRWADFDTNRPLRPWLAGIAFRVARNHLRRQRWDRMPVALDPGGEASGLEVADVNDLLAQREQQQEASEARALVLNALARLPERYRSPLVLHDLDEVPVNEIARLLELPLATVYTRLRRARLAFAKVVGELRGPQPAAGYARAVAPISLLGLERKLPPAPALARTRAEAFARRITELPSPPPDPLAGATLAPGSTGGKLATLTRPTVWVAGAALVTGAVLLAVFLNRASPVRPPVVSLTAPAAPAGTTARVAAKPRPRSVPVFQRPAAAPAVAFSRAVAEGLGQGLTGYWPMDDGPGARLVRDHSGAGRHCRFHDLRAADRVWIAGVSGQALALNATVWLDCPQPEVARDQATEVTLAAWTRRRSARSPAAVVTRQIGTSFEDQFFLGYKQDSLRLLSHAWTGSGLGVTAPPPSDRWHHLAFTRERDGTTRLYLDGVVVAEKPSAPRGTGAIDTPITIGAGRYSRFGPRVRQRLDGDVDEVLAYGRALSAMEVRALAAGLRPVLPAE